MYENSTGSCNTCIGFEAHVSSSNLTNVTVIGASGVCSTSNTIQLGNTDIQYLYCQVALTTTSDIRFKNNIETLKPSLEFVKTLKPVTFDWTPSEKHIIDSVPIKRDTGLIAQDLVESQKTTNYFVPNLVDETNREKYGVNYTTLIPVLIKSIQELSDKVNEQNERIKTLEEKLSSR
jgi:hypothetical protein